MSNYDISYRGVVNSAALCLGVTVILIFIAAWVAVYARRIGQDESSYAADDWRMVAWIVGITCGIVSLVLLVFAIDGLANTSLRATQTVWEMQNPAMRIQSR